MSEAQLISAELMTNLLFILRGEEFLNLVMSLDATLQRLKSTGSVRSNGGQVTSLSITSTDATAIDKWEDNPGYEYVGPLIPENDAIRSYVLRRDNRERDLQIWAFFWRGEKVGSIERPLSNPINNPHNNALIYPTNTLRYRPTVAIEYQKLADGKGVMTLTDTSTELASRHSRKPPVRCLLAARLSEM